jgi:nitrite reductase (NADH) small subunit/3-phenylpropionate/trans-cinnamate dioxygenase ferredoxin subunit
VSDFTTVCRAGDIPAGEGRTFTVGERLVAVFFVDGAYRAIDDLCPHQHASLGAGCVEDGEVFCPWHGWRFRLCDGKWADNPRLGVDVFETRVVGQEVQVRVGSGQSD